MKPAKVLGWILLCFGFVSANAQAFELSGSWRQWTSWRGVNEASSVSAASAPNLSWNAPRDGSSVDLRSVGYLGEPTNADAKINFGSGPFRLSDLLTTGNNRPWYESPSVTQFFGGAPNAQQQADFVNTVVQRVEQTYEQSGIGLNLTTDPKVFAPHELSVVSGSSNANNPNAVGITVVGESGFSFIDKFQNARSLDQLSWAVSHNVAHELMHAFGADHHDATGQFLDSGVTSWDVMVDPNARFSSSAVADLASRDFRSVGGAALQQVDHSHASGGLCDCLAFQLTNDPIPQHSGNSAAPTPAPVPEPSSLLLWVGLAAVGLTIRAKVKKTV